LKLFFNGKLVPLTKFLPTGDFFFPPVENHPPSLGKVWWGWGYSLEPNLNILARRIKMKKKDYVEN